MKKTKGPYPFVIASQYFLFFGVMGVFIPYFNLYCFHIGFNGFQIGILSALKSLTTIIFPLFWGALADRLKMRKPIYICCNFISSAIWVFFILTTDFGWMLTISVLYGIFYAPIISFLEALTMDVLGEKKKNYGQIRAWGSISFILTVIIIGKIIDLFSIEIILFIIFIGSFLQAIFSCKIPYLNSQNKASYALSIRFFLQKRIVLFLLCAFLMLVSHGTYYGFFSIHLENLGYGNTFIGMTWALASIAEISAMIKSKNIFEQFSLEKVLLFSFAVATIRWIILYSVTSPVFIILSQVLHALTYGTFHMASILYIDRISPDEAKTVGQGINNAVTYGLGLMVGFFINGYFYELLGSKALFMLSAGIALAGGALFGGGMLTATSDNRQIGKPAN